jgi:hypothetical protein
VALHITTVPVSLTACLHYLTAAASCGVVKLDIGA